MMGIDVNGKIEVDYSEYVNAILLCKEKQDPKLKHEWTFTDFQEAFEVGSVFLSMGWGVKWISVDLPFGQMHYLGVPFECLKNK